MGMMKEHFSPMKGQIVLAQGHTGKFKVLELSADGQTADIQAFSVSKQRLLGNTLRVVPCTMLLPIASSASDQLAFLSGFF